VYVALILLAVAWGAGSGVFLPRAAYRLSVQPDHPWRRECPAGHPITGPAGGWIGRAGCPVCSAAVVAAGDGDGRRNCRTQENARPDSASQEAGLQQTGVQAGGADAGNPGPAYAPSLLVASLTALSCGVLASATGARPELLVWLLITPFAMLLAVVDRKVHRLPDQLTLPLAVATVVLLGLAALVPGHAGSWRTALLGAGVLGGCYFALSLINPNGMGFGDVKLALSLGAVLGWYGWPPLFVGAFAGFLLGSMYGLALMLLGRAGRKSAIPFGPFMITGALLGVVLGALAAR